MPQFKLSAHERLFLEIEGKQHWFVTCEHPAAQGMAHVMEGGQARVYHLATLAGGHEHGLKVLKGVYSSPAMVEVCERLNALKNCAGLTVCYRVCFSPEQAAATLRQHPGLAYSILMPWIHGLCWFEVLQRRKPLEQASVLALATSLATILARLESMGMAHSDISSGNVVVDLERLRIELIDVEDMFAPSWPHPAYVSHGTPGYQHLASGQGQWRQHGDRFAAAVLLSEILGWYDDEVRAACYGESFFEDTDLQQPDSKRLELLSRAVAGQSQRAADLLRQAWSSTTLADCPSMSEWRQACLPEIPFEPLRPRPSLADVTTPVWTPLARASDRPGGSEVRWEGSLLPGADGLEDQVEWTKDSRANAFGVQWESGARSPGKSGR